jgi:hypothetical protein
MQKKEEMRLQQFTMIESWQQSGLSQKQYCRQNNIPYHAFHYWYKRYREQQVSAVQAFVPLTVHQSFSGNVEIQYADGKRLIFHQPVSSDYLKVLLG